MSGLIRPARTLAVQSWRRGISKVAFWLAAGDTAPRIRETFDGTVPLGARICVFAHYDRHGEVWPHTRRYLEALAEAGFSIILVSNSPTLTSDSITWLRARCARILLRENRGYDFGAYRDGLLQVGREPGRCSILLIANDSVYAPLAPLGPFLDRMDFTHADVWSATDSWQHRYHLQSYLIAFSGAAMASLAFWNFWDGVRNVRSKWSVIRHYEIGLTAHLLAAKLRCAAVFETHDLVRHAENLLHTSAKQEDVGGLPPALRHVAQRALGAAARRVAVNPTIDLWLLLAEAGSPFLKRELLRDDPNCTPDLAIWHQLLRGRAPDLYREVVDDLRRSVRHAAP
jgi:hypothetical protein